jgi:cellulose synthase (UDP-forming)
VTLDSYGVHVKQAQSYLSLLSGLEAFWSLSWEHLLGRLGMPRQSSNLGGIPDAVMEEFQSPVSADRSFVLILLRQNSSADALIGALLDRSQPQDMNGSVSLLRNSRVESYRMDGITYYVGNISHFSLMRIYLTQTSYCYCCWSRCSVSCWRDGCMDG